jgi:ElaB/YqjD/DUF883 family membrane-anchored ribosome-binding protein
MKNMISGLTVFIVVILSVTPVFAFGDPANSPNLNANVYNTFQSEREGLRTTAAQIVVDARNARTVMGEKAASVERSVSQTASAVESFVQRASSPEFREDVNNRVESNIQEVSGNYQNFKNEAGAAAKQGFDNFKRNVKNTVSNTSINMRRKINPIQFSIKDAVQKTGSAVGHAIDNVLSR